MRRDKQEAQAQFNRRSLLLSGLGAGAFAALGARMYGLQVLEQHFDNTVTGNSRSLSIEGG